MLFTILVQIPGIVEFFKNGFQDAVFYGIMYSIWGVLLLFEIPLFFKFLPWYVKKVKKLKRERDIRE